MLGEKNILKTSPLFFQLVNLIFSFVCLNDLNIVPNKLAIAF